MYPETENDFVGLCARGLASMESVDDFVDAWHEGGSGVPLHVFLGMTRDEYAHWVVDPDCLGDIIASRSFRAATGRIDSALNHVKVIKAPFSRRKTLRKKYITNKS